MIYDLLTGIPTDGQTDTGTTFRVFHAPLMWSFHIIAWGKKRRMPYLQLQSLRKTLQIMTRFIMIRLMRRTMRIMIHHHFQQLLFYSFFYFVNIFYVLHSCEFFLLFFFICLQNACIVIRISKTLLFLAFKCTFMHESNSTKGS